KAHNAHTFNKINVSTGILSFLMWIENYFGNIDAFSKYPGIGALKGRFKGVPMVIAGAGPSLKKNAHLLKDIKGKALIVSAITAYKPLLRYGVVPDFVIAAEKVDLPEYFTYGEDDLKTRLILGEVSHPNMFKRDVKGKFIYFNRYIKLSVEQARFWGKGDYFPSSGGSVTTSAFDMGMLFGCDPIIFVGQDLSFGGGRTHVDGGVYVEQNVKIDIEKGKIIIEEDYVQPDMTMGKLSHNFDLLWLKGLDGKSIPSKYDWVVFHQWFESFMRSLKETNDPTKVINATEGGAFIEGMEHVTLKEAIDRHILHPAPVEEIIRDAEATPQVDIKGLLGSFSNMHDAIRDIKRLSRAIIKEAGSLKKEMERTGMSVGLKDGVDRIKRLEEKLFSKTGKAVFIWDALVSYTYTLKQYMRQDELDDKEGQFKREIDTISTTYKKVEETCERFLPLINKALKTVGPLKAGQHNAEKDQEVEALKGSVIARGFIVARP
ncbi:MAG: motility associated factor glycosyltransferase family protein, partial [Deltaproteobacteria bacterium]|nr:motility associated factor glycosyltransferase family protein [Deltaproteobacteria bacterium]